MDSDVTTQSHGTDNWAAASSAASACHAGYWCSMYVRGIWMHFISSVLDAFLKIFLFVFAPCSLCLCSSGRVSLFTATDFYACPLRTLVMHAADLRKGAACIPCGSGGSDVGQCISAARLSELPCSSSVCLRGVFCFSSADHSACGGSVCSEGCSSVLQLFYRKKFRSTYFDFFLRS